MFRYLTAGESHGPQLTAIVEGLPAGLGINEETINRDLQRRQGGYGRGGRMLIETDKAFIRSGVRWGETLGSPVTLVVENADWVNWEKKMSPYSEHQGECDSVTRARPGHADLPGALKYGHHDVRNILERSSARETAVRVAVGALAKIYLSHFGISVNGCVIELGGVRATRPEASLQELQDRINRSPVYTYDTEAELEMINTIDRAKAAGDSLGGVVEVRVNGVPAGLGSHVQWDRRLDARLAGAVMSIQAFKGVEIGAGFQAARVPGSQVHDEIFFDGSRVGEGAATGFYRTTNRAGGLEGGITNGEEIVVCGAMKPIPTLYTPLRSVDIVSKEAFEATVERSDVCAVPAASVVAEAVVAIEIANAFMDKFGGDSIGETERNLKGYLEYLKTF
ncbi:chorismate synthase [Geomonas sp. Red32]|uniref:chorismate synthase n=1 Tax=Geomonas sp. Red32 TaxID=2912856 RepID=UPI00202CB525|nr:chorismate synthase [Geomonas sp. Red32]MCM0083678.1 chorismate synthase [Geomonas sp. Red32]